MMPRAETTLGASRKMRKSHGHVRRATLYGNLQEGKAHEWTCQKTHSVWKLTRKSPAPFRCPHFVSKFTGKTHMDMSQEPFGMEIYGKNVAHPFRRSHFVRKFKGRHRHPRAHLDQTPAFYCNRKNPFSVATLFGKNKVYT